MSRTGHQLTEIYEVLLAHYGPQGWWPAQDETETIIGCILVQHTAWANAERAIRALRDRGLLDFSAIDGIACSELAEVVRPAGTPTVKSNRLKAFARKLGQDFSFDLQAMLALPLDRLRTELLTVSGIGPETADCIALYAAGQPAFIADVYAHRVMTRHKLAAAGWRYPALKEMFEAHLPGDAKLFNEYHALLVAVGKAHCGKTARCEACPLAHLDHDPDLGTH